MVNIGLFVGRIVVMSKSIPLIEFVPVYEYKHNNHDLILTENIESQRKDTSYPFNRNYTNTFSEPCPKRLEDEYLQDLITYKTIPFYEEKETFDSIRNKLGTPCPKNAMVYIGERFVYPRNQSISQFALLQANYKCEINIEHKTFIKKSHNVPYTEPHHLIPLAFADNFDVSLDVPENIISLCSNCHNQLHYGKDIVVILNRLYESRKKQLEKVGLKISFEELLWMYNIDN